MAVIWSVAAAVAEDRPAGPAAGQASQPAADKAAASDGISFCERELNALRDKANGLKEKDLEDLTAALASATKKKEEQAAHGPTESAAGTKETGISAVEIAKAKAALDGAREAVKLFESYQAMAQRELEAAKAEPNPSLQRVHVKEALSKMDNARSLVRQAAVSVGADPERRPATTQQQQPETTVSTNRPPRTGISLGESGSLERLKTMANLGQSIGQQGWDRGLGPEPARQAAGGPTLSATSFFSAPRLDPDANAVVLPSGNRIGLAPLQAAVDKASHAPATQPALTTSVGHGDAPRPTEKLLGTIGNKQQLEEARKVGGVALDITLDLLAYSGIADLRGSGARVLVESPSLLSLRKLLAEVAPYGASPEQWASLPERLRYPGNLGRLYGFVVDPERQDINLIGTPAASEETRIDIDSLVLLIPSVWLERQFPYVSLDPVPTDFAGPQYVRVGNVPVDSVVARIMLDADYDMKQIDLGTMPISAPGYKNSKQLMEEYPAEIPLGTFRSRAWFAPVPLGWSTVRRSPSGRTVLVATNVQVLSEGEPVDGIVSDYRSNPIGTQQAQLSTKALPYLEQDMNVQPRGIFGQLHGLVDVATMAAIWQHMRLDYPLLHELARLPHRHVEVRTYYPGLTNSWSWIGMPRKEGTQTVRYSFTFKLSGGALLRARTESRAINRSLDTIAADIEDAVERFAPSAELTHRLGVTFALSDQVTGDASSRVEQEHAQALLASGNEDVARDAFKSCTESDPLDADGWSGLAQAEARLGNFAAARTAIVRALALEPTEPTVRMAALDIEWRADPQAARAASDEGTRRDLSLAYSEGAFSALAQGRSAAALEMVKSAVGLWGDNADAYLVRSLLTEEEHDKRRDTLRAIRLYKQLAAQRQIGNWQTRGALAHSVIASQSVDRALRQLSVKPLTEGQVDPERTQLMLAELAIGEDSGNEAMALDPRLPWAFETTVKVRALKLVILRHTGMATDSAALWELANRAVANFPDHPGVFVARAILAEFDDRASDALRDLDTALRLSPKNIGALVSRAMVRAETGDCDGARIDIDEANDLGGPLGLKPDPVPAVCR